MLATAAVIIEHRNSVDGRRAIQLALRDLVDEVTKLVTGLPLETRIPDDFMLTEVRTKLELIVPGMLCRRALATAMSTEKNQRASTSLDPVAATRKNR